MSMIYQQVYTLREFNSNVDLNKVIEINRLCLPENYSANFFLDIYKNCPKSFIVAEISNEIVGYAMARLEYGLSEFSRLKFVRKGHLVSIAVLQSHRKLGIGRSLLFKVLEGLSKSGASECYLEVRITNSSGIKLYTSADFKIIRSAPMYYHDGADAYVMARKLLFYP